MSRRSVVVRIFQVVALIVVPVLFLALIINVFQNDGKPLTTLAPAGPSADSIQRLVIPVFAIAGVVFVGVMGAVLFISWRFREKPSDDPEEFPEQVHGKTVLEIGWTILPALILAGVAVGTVVTILELNQTDDDAMHVQVIGNQWWWEYKYDVDNDGSYDSPADITTATEMVVPVGKQVALDITSNDVIHSFWIPELNGKADAVPGQNHDWKLEASREGVFRGQCTEFCGLSHANMRMLVRAVPQDEYDAWLENQQTVHSDDPSDPLAAEGKDQWVALCSQCHVIDGVNGPDDADPQPTPPLVSGVAPNLTHLMTRGTFAGSIYNLYDPTEPGNYDAVLPPDDVAAVGNPGEALTGGPVDESRVNRATLEAWIRNAPAMKPMYAQGGRGMPALGLSETQIDQIVAYLLTLN